MQRSLMDSAVRSAYFESVALRALRALPPAYTASVAEATGVSVAALEVLRNTLYETDLYVLRPATKLPVSLFGFEDGGLPALRPDALVRYAEALMLMPLPAGRKSDGSGRLNVCARFASFA
jgi:hypothetical protein